ncbi:MAG: class I SAM-dependent methyltransferase [Deltaproteobacteria bacterium]|nr:class I SAM-dependent methyltransferase [Deltaproteobacteria bacterium]
MNKVEDNPNVTNAQVEENYQASGITESITKALGTLGKDPSDLTATDLAPVDQFHIRGLAATKELADLGGLSKGMRVLDVGCGLGGPARYLATKHGCRVTGLDITRDYVMAAGMLTKLVRLDHQVGFIHGSALEIPAEDGRFDVVWTEHAQMNIFAKEGFYREIARVLKPGGRLVFHDVFRGAGPQPRYPVPWATESAISYLRQAEVIRKIIESAGFQIDSWEDTTAKSLAWFQAVSRKRKSPGRSSLGLHLLLGETAPIRVANLIKNLQDQRIRVVQAVARKQSA